MPEEETIANCWTEIIDVEQDDGRVLPTSTLPLAYHLPPILKGAQVHGRADVKSTYVFRELR